MTRRSHQLLAVTIADEPGAWADAGFVVDNNRVRIANTTIDLVGAAAGRGILGAGVAALSGDVDGLRFDDAAAADVEASTHPNGVVALDHLVALTPDVDRTSAALIGAGLDLRRTRLPETDGRHQAFFWLGDVILELAGTDLDHCADPAAFWGLALTCDDLDRASAVLGDALGQPKAAVQQGRRIATLRTRDLDISVAVALMSSHEGSRS